MQRGRLMVLVAAVTWFGAGPAPAAPQPESVLFLQGGDLWVAPTDNVGARQRLAGGGPLAATLWLPRLYGSPWGDRVLVVCPDEPRLYVVEGGGRIRPLGSLTAGAPEPAPRADWSPDEAWIALGSSSGASVVRVADGRRHEVTPRPSRGDGGKPIHRWSGPVGWRSRTELVVVQEECVLPDRQEARTAFYLSPVPPEPSRVAQPVTIMDGEHHASALVGGGQGAVAWVETDILRVDLGTGQRQVLASGLPRLDESATCEAKRLPQGDLLFVAFDGDSHQVEHAWRIAGDGSRATSLEAAAADGLLRPPLSVEVWAQLQRWCATDQGSDPRARVACSPRPLDYWLPPEPSAGAATTVRASSEPSGAEVYVNGHCKGRTPCVVTITSAQPWAQRYFIAFMEDGRAVEARELFLRQGQEEQLSVKLATPVAPPNAPVGLAGACNAVRKAIVHRDREAFVQYVPPQGIVVSDEVTEVRLSREKLRQALRRRGEGAGGILEECRAAFLQGAFVWKEGHRWWADVDAYSYRWLDFTRADGRWCVKEMGGGSANE